MSFFRYRYKQLFNGACYIDITDSLARHCWVNSNKQWCLAKKIKFLLKFCVKKWSWSEIVYQRVHKQKLVSVICEEVADDD